MTRRILEGSCKPWHPFTPKQHSPSWRLKERTQTTACMGYQRCRSRGRSTRKLSASKVAALSFIAAIFGHPSHNGANEGGLFKSPCSQSVNSSLLETLSNGTVALPS